MYPTGSATDAPGRISPTRPRPPPAPTADSSRAPQPEARLDDLRAFPRSPIGQASQASQADFGSPDDTPIHSYGHLMVGGGVRTLWNLIDYLQLLEEHRPALEAMRRQGADFANAMRQGVVDGQPRHCFGGGYAFTDAHDGTQNTPAEPGIEALYQRYLRGHFEELIHDPAYQGNPPALQMLDESRSLAMPTAEDFVVARAVLLRKNMNRMDRGYYEELLARVADWFPEFSVERHHRTEAVSLRLDGPRPVVLARHLPTGAPQRLEAGFVSLHTGPTPRPAVTGAAAALFFQGPMNRRDVGRALDALGLLDERRLLRPGVRLVAGGLGLSALDVLVTLNPLTGLLTMDGERWVVDGAAAARYQGALTMLSRQLRPAVPRYTYGIDLPAGVPALGSTEELLALFVHADGQQVFDAWFTLEQAAIAAALGQTPAALRQEPPLDEQLRIWHRQTEAVRAIEDAAKRLPPAQRAAKLAECCAQEEAIRRSIHLRTVVGLGMEHPGTGGVPGERGIDDTFEQLRRCFPRLAAERIGHPMHRAHTYAVSRAGRRDPQDNQRLFQVLEHRMRWVTASPWQVQSMMDELHRAGVLAFQCGSYQDFSVVEAGDGRRRLLHASDAGAPEPAAAGFDMGLVQPVFDARTPFAASFGEQVVSGLDHLPDAASDRRYHPRVGKNNLLTAGPTGLVLPVAHYGLSMHGYHRPGQDWHNVLGHDRNDKDATIADSGSKALRDLSLAVLRSAGVAQPHAALERLYTEEAARIGDYAREIARLEPAYHRAMAKACAVRSFDRQLAQQAAMPPGRPVRLAYGDLAVSAPDAPDAFCQAVQALAAASAEGGCDITATWRRSLDWQAWRPPETADGYDSRFVDHPPLVHEKVRARAFALAAETLGRARAGAETPDRR